MKDSACDIESSVRTDGSSNGIGCGGGVSESPSLDLDDQVEVILLQ